MNKKSISVLMLSALLAMTSCSKDDSLEMNTVQASINQNANQVAKPLSGEWYGCYKAQGTAVSDNGDGKTTDYQHVFDVYEFYENGTGTFHRHFMNDKSATPEISWGKEGRGDFTYTSTADGKVTITLKNQQGLPIGKQWTLKCKDDDIVAVGANDTDITLSPVNDSMAEVLNAWNGDGENVTRGAAAAAAGAASINKFGIDIIDNYGLLVRFSGYELGKYGEGYICGTIIGDHRELIEIPEFANCGLINAPLMYRIIGIDNWAFKNHDHIRRITIPQSCIHIGDEAFKGCTQLVDVQMNCTKLGDRAFEGCTALETVNICPASGFNKISKECFKGCTRLSSFQCPQNITTIDDGAFKGCSNLITFTYSEHLTTIGKEAFSGCSKLSSGYLPAQLETIGDEAFRYCHSLVTLNIPKSIKKIGKKAFADCSELSSVVPAQFGYINMADDVRYHDDALLHKPSAKKDE